MLDLYTANFEELVEVNNNFDGSCNFCKAEYLGHSHSVDCSWKRRWDKVMQMRRVNAS